MFVVELAVIRQRQFELEADPLCSGEDLMCGWSSLRHTGVVELATQSADQRCIATLAGQRGKLVEQLFRVFVQRDRHCDLTLALPPRPALYDTLVASASVDLVWAVS